MLVTLMRVVGFLRSGCPRRAGTKTITRHTRRSANLILALSANLRLRSIATLGQRPAGHVPVGPKPSLQCRTLCCISMSLARTRHAQVWRRQPAGGESSGGQGSSSRKPLSPNCSEKQALKAARKKFFTGIEVRRPQASFKPQTQRRRTVTRRLVPLSLRCESSRPGLMPASSVRTAGAPAPFQRGAFLEY